MQGEYQAYVSDRGHSVIHTPIIGLSQPAFCMWLRTEMDKHIAISTYRKVLEVLTENGDLRLSVGRNVIQIDRNTITFKSCDGMNIINHSASLTEHRDILISVFQELLDRCDGSSAPPPSYEECMRQESNA